MGIAVDVVRVAAKTSGATTTQDITVDVGGLTPKGYLIFCSYATTDNTAADEGVFSIGMSDGTTSRVIGQHTEHNQSTTDVSAWVRSGRVVQITLNGTVEGYAAHSSFAADTITIDWTDYFNSAYLMTVVAFAGSDLSLETGFTTLTTSTVDITSPGFEPDFVLAMATGDQTNSDTGIGGDGLCFGWSSYDGVSTYTQRCIGFVDRDARSTSEAHLKTENDYASMRYLHTGGVGASASINDFDSNGFSIVPSTNWSNRGIAWMAVSLGASGLSQGSADVTIAASTGDKSETGFGFKPQFLLQLTSLAQGTDNAYTDNRAGVFGVSAATASAQYNTTYATEDAQSTTDTQSLSDDQLYRIPDDDGTAEYAGTLTSFTATGFDYNISDAPAGTRITFALAIEEESTGDLSINVSDSVTVSESTTVIIPDLHISKAESVTVSEASAVSLVNFIDVSDSVTVAEQTTVNTELNILVDDSISVSDAIDLELEIYISVSETITVSEAVTVSVVSAGELNISVSDSVTASEAVTVSLTTGLDLSITVSETVSITDAVTVLLPELHLSVADAVTVSEAIVLAFNPLLISTNDAVTVADSPGLAFNPLLISLAESVTVSEDTTVTVGEVVAVAIALTLQARSFDLKLERRSLDLIVKDR